MRQNRKILPGIHYLSKSSVIFLLTIFLISCCLIEELQFSRDTLPDATLNQVYKVVITADIRNGFNDAFYFDFKFSGTLPNGVSYIKDKDNRQVIISGTPTELGSFQFTLEGYVTPNYTSEAYSEYYSSDNFLVDLSLGIACQNNYDIQQTYTLNVNM